MYHKERFLLPVSLSAFLPSVFLDCGITSSRLLANALGLLFIVYESYDRKVKVTV